MGDKDSNTAGSSNSNSSELKKQIKWLKITVTILAAALILFAVKVFWPNQNKSGGESSGRPETSQEASGGLSSTETADALSEDSSGTSSADSLQDSAASEVQGDSPSEIPEANAGSHNSAEQTSAPDTVKGDFLLTCSAQSSWQENGTQMRTLDMSLTNRTDSAVKEWTLILEVEDLAGVSGWNGTFTTKGNTVTITNAEHNGNIPPGGAVYLGCNIGTKKEFHIKSASVNGQSCSVADGTVDQDSINHSGGSQSSESQAPNQSGSPASSDVKAVLKRAEKAVQGDDWLHTDGRRILDKDGREVWLTGVNWFGYNTGTNTFDGLWNSQMETTVKAIADHGFNLIRVPFSAQLINQWAAGEYPKANFNQASNPSMVSMNSLEIFDYFLSLAEANGIKILIDIHSAETDPSGHNVNLWYTGKVSTENYYAALEWMAARYKDFDTIIAYDLKNEPHGKPYEGDSAAIWNDSKKPNNWKYIAQTAAAKVLAKNPNVLILIEGTEIYPKNHKGDYSSKNDSDYYFNWWGGNLRAVKDFPIDLGKYQNKLVYSPHDYGPTVFKQPWFEGNYTYDSLMKDCWHDNWFFIYEDNTAPLLIGEWGGFMKEPNLTWMTHMRKLISTYHLNHTFWCLNANSGDTGGLLLDDFVTWDEQKYNFVKDVLWQENGKFVGLDHEIALGDNGIALKETKGLK
ncbi:MAG: cellulase family glycosylhydrolase [Lachnospiraceae bacterium]|nr:cellulase family glycosylhydrolase [Lachnospiraceae bacterium]